MYEFNVVASDGQWTIGYDADGVAGIVNGNTKDSFEKASEFQSVKKDTSSVTDTSFMWPKSSTIPSETRFYSGIRSS